MHTIIEIEGRDIYYCRVDSKGLIVVSDPHNELFHLKPLKEVYERYKAVAKFSVYYSDLEPDFIPAEEVYKKMQAKNPLFDKLVKEFDVDISS